MNATAARDDTDRDGSLEPSGVLVRPGWLQERLGHDGLRLVDLRDADAYHRGHLPRAVHLDLASLGRRRAGLDNVLLGPDTFAERMRELGVSARTLVVAYDDQWGLAAARLLWALHFYGHDAVSVLDGGWDRWLEEGRPTTDAISTPVTGTFEGVARPELGATPEWLAEHAGSGDVALLDTRSPAEYAQGHLPEATSWDWLNAVPPGSWDASREKGELLDEWETLGITPNREVVVYCRSGMRAAHTYMVLKHTGYPRVRLYDGSWQEWSATRRETDS